METGTENRSEHCTGEDLGKEGSC